MASASSSGPRLALATCAEMPGLDEEGRLLLAACRARGIAAEPVVWSDGDVAWPEYDRVLIRSTWDYQDRLGEFLAWTERIGDRLINRPPIVAWNCSKRYLPTLAEWGFPIVPTAIAGAEDDAAALLQPEFTGAGDFVVKPTVSAGSRNTARYRQHQREAALAHATDLLRSEREVMVQPFIDSVETAAETAVVLIAGRPAHAMRKGPLLERDQELETGLFREEDMTSREAAPEELELARAVVGRFSEEVAPPLYARVDMLRGAGGAPLVLELELIEPSLFLEFNPGSAPILLDALAPELGL